jgi:hypothetical protein
MYDRMSVLHQLSSEYKTYHTLEDSMARHSQNGESRWLGSVSQWPNNKKWGQNELAIRNPQFLSSNVWPRWSCEDFEKKVIEAHHLC